MAANVLCIAVHHAVPVQTLNELIAYAKANPGKLSYGHSGVGSIQHLTGELFKSLTGTPEIVQVPYRGTGPVITDLVGGQIPMGTPGVTGQVIELHRSGKMRVLAVTSSTRLVAAPELPTAAELGFPGMTVRGSIGLLAPAGTPVGIIEQVAQATRTAIAEPAYQQLLIDAGIEPTLEFKPRKIPAVPRCGCCSLGTDRQSARAEARLTVAQICRFSIDVRFGSKSDFRPLVWHVRSAAGRGHARDRPLCARSGQAQVPFRESDGPVRSVGHRAALAALNGQGPPYSAPQSFRMISARYFRRSLG